MEDDSQTIKLIAIDIDGTLLTPQGQITPRVRAAVQAALRAGVMVTLATARRYRGAQAMAEALGLEFPLIVYDGSLIVSHPARTILASRTLGAGTAWQVIKVFQRSGIQPIIHPCERGRCVAEEVWTGPAEYDHPELTPYLTAAAGRVRRMPYAMLSVRAAQALRAVAFANQETIEHMLPEIAALDCSWNFALQGSYGSAELAILPAGCSKASAIAALATHYQLALKQVMALGDGYNDLEMLRLVGLGVAMGQAPEQVKAAARAVTATNGEDGVAQAIERYVLGAYPEETLTVAEPRAEEAAPQQPSNVFPEIAS